MISTMMIALPSSVKVFNWLGTIWRGSIRFDPPTLFALSFVSLFTIGGLSGIFMAATPVDIFIHDTYFIVAHFHYVVFGGTLFAVFGGIFFWYPKMFGRMMNDKLGKLHWFMTFVFFNAVFFPMHIIGAGGHMRRIATIGDYEWLKIFQGWNRMITVSAIILGFSQTIFVFNFFWSMYMGRKAENNPWQSNTLEWTMLSPPGHGLRPMPQVHAALQYSGENDRDWASQTEPPHGSRAPLGPMSTTGCGGVSRDDRRDDASRSSRGGFVTTTATGDTVSGGLSSGAGSRRRLVQWTHHALAMVVDRWSPRWRSGRSARSRVPGCARWCLRGRARAGALIGGRIYVPKAAVSIVHACFAQVVFCAITTTVSLSRMWSSPPR
jgi:hypothetical protein